MLNEQEKQKIMITEDIMCNLFVKSMMEACDENEQNKALAKTITNSAFGAVDQAKARIKLNVKMNEDFWIEINKMLNLCRFDISQAQDAIAQWKQLRLANCREQIKAGCIEPVMEQDLKSMNSNRYTTNFIGFSAQWDNISKEYPDDALWFEDAVPNELLEAREYLPQDIVHHTSLDLFENGKDLFEARKISEEISGLMPFFYAVLSFGNNCIYDSGLYMRGDNIPVYLAHIDNIGLFKTLIAMDYAVTLYQMRSRVGLTRAEIQLIGSPGGDLLYLMESEGFQRVKRMFPEFQFRFFSTNL